MISVSADFDCTFQYSGRTGVVRKSHASVTRRDARTSRFVVVEKLTGVTKNLRILDTRI
jgi:hypothetical protein